MSYNDPTVSSSDKEVTLQWASPDGTPEGSSVAPHTEMSAPPSAPYVQSGSSSYGQSAPQPQASPYGSPAAMPHTWAPQATAQPGVIPLRPLTISDLFDGTFKTLRSNPGVVFGFSMLVMAITATISAALYFLIPQDMLLGSFTEAGVPLDAALEVSHLMVSNGILSVLSLFSALVISGILSVAVTDAVIGRKITISQAWERCKGRIGALLGNQLLNALLFLVIAIIVILVAILITGALISTLDSTSPVALFLLLLILVPVAFIPIFYLSVRFVYCATVIVVEKQGPLAAFSRSWAMTRSNFWATFGRFILVSLMVQIATSILGTITGIVTAVLATALPGSFAAVVSLYLTALTQGLALPLMGIFITLMYIDRRIRTEGIADALLRASQN